MKYYYLVRDGAVIGNTIGMVDDNKYYDEESAIKLAKLLSVNGRTVHVWYGDFDDRDASDVKVVVCYDGNLQWEMN